MNLRLCFRRLSPLLLFMIVEELCTFILGFY